MPLRKLSVIQISLLFYVLASIAYIAFNETEPRTALILWTIFYYNINKGMLVLGLGFNFITNKTQQDMQCIKFLMVQSLCFMGWLDIGTTIFGWDWICEHRADSYVFLCGGLVALIWQWIDQRKNAL